jgi:hypothetical protein
MKAAKVHGRGGKRETEKMNPRQCVESRTTTNKPQLQQKMSRDFGMSTERPAPMTRAAGAH